MAPVSVLRIPDLYVEDPPVEEDDLHAYEELVHEEDGALPDVPDAPEFFFVLQPALLRTANASDAWFTLVLGSGWSERLHEGLHACGSEREALNTTADFLYRLVREAEHRDATPADVDNLLSALAYLVLQPNAHGATLHCGGDRLPLYGDDLVWRYTARYLMEVVACVACTGTPPPPLAVTFNVLVTPVIPDLTMLSHLVGEEAEAVRLHADGRILAAVEAEHGLPPEAPIFGRALHAAREHGSAILACRAALA